MDEKHETLYLLLIKYLIYGTRKKLWIVVRKKGDCRRIYLRRVSVGFV
jgi:hypothetical protein